MLQSTKMLRLLILGVVLHCSSAQQYQQKVAPGVPPQQYQNYQPPPPPPQHQQQQQQQYQQQQQQYQPPPQQQYQQQVPVQQIPVQQVPVQQVPVPQGQNSHAHHGDPQLLNPGNMEHEREHIQEHMEVPIDTSKMSQSELQFHYFKMHDADHNNKLDGCELIKSLIHWHGEIDKNHKVYKDAELETMLDYVMNHTDLNRDGYIDYTEYKINNFKGQKAAEAAEVAAKAASGVK